MESGLFQSFATTRRSRNLCWELTRDQAVSQWPNECCHYCNAAPSQSRSGSKSRPQDAVKFNSLDRLDSALGYTIDNVVPCCKICNFAKNTMSVEEFRAWLSRVYGHFVLGLGRERIPACEYEAVSAIEAAA